MIKKMNGLAGCKRRAKVTIISFYTIPPIKGSVFPIVLQDVAGGYRIVPATQDFRLIRMEGVDVEGAAGRLFVEYRVAGT
jgi:hypothetical protein